MGVQHQDPIGPQEAFLPATAAAQGFKPQTGTLNQVSPTIWLCRPGSAHCAPLPVAPVPCGMWRGAWPADPALTLQQPAGSRLGGLGGDEARGLRVGD